MSPTKADLRARSLLVEAHREEFDARRAEHLAACSPASGGERHRQRCRSRSRALWDLIRAHRAQYDVLVARERRHAQRWLVLSGRAPHVEPEPVQSPILVSVQVARADVPLRLTQSELLARRRDRVVAMAKVGRTNGEIAAHVGVSRQTVIRDLRSMGVPDRRYQRWVS